MHLHKWLPWTDPIATYNTGRKCQWRTCKICNKAQKRTMWWDHQVTAGQICEALKQTKGS